MWFPFSAPTYLSAIARPIPRLAPVIKTVLPFKERDDMLVEGRVGSREGEVGRSNKNRVYSSARRVIGCKWQISAMRTTFSIQKEEFEKKCWQLKASRWD